MAKRDINGRGGGRVKAALSKYRKALLEETFEKMDGEKRIKPAKKPGAKEIILGAYRKNRDKEDAYIAMKLFNQKVGLQAFTQEMVDVWISEYENSLESNREDGR